MKEKTIEEIINEETKNRIEEMKKVDYEFPEKFKKEDYYLIVVLITISLLLIVLCITGVIK